MNPEDIDQIASAVDARRNAAQLKGIDKIPGGIAGACLAVGILAFIGKDMFEKSNKESETLNDIRTGQILLTQRVDGLAGDIRDLQSKTVDRYTNKDAGARALAVDREIAKIQSKLDHRGDDWMPSVEMRLNKIEMKLESERKK